MNSPHPHDFHAFKSIWFVYVFLRLHCLSVFSVSLIVLTARSNVRHLMWIRGDFLPRDVFRFRENKTLKISDYLEV